MKLKGIGVKPTETIIPSSFLVIVELRVVLQAAVQQAEVGALAAWAVYPVALGLVVRLGQGVSLHVCRRRMADESAPSAYESDVVAPSSWAPPPPPPPPPVLL